MSDVAISHMRDNIIFTRHTIDFFSLLELASAETASQ
jgi:hypothetical protein